jgi:hypothetical protein
MEILGKFLFSESQQRMLKMVAKLMTIMASMALCASAAPLNFTIMSTVDLVYDATNTPGYPLVSPIQVGDTLTYSVSANQSSCQVEGQTSNSAAFFCSGATDGVTMSFQTSTGTLTFSTLGYLYFTLYYNYFVAPGHEQDAIQFETISSDYPAVGSFDTTYTALNLNPPYDLVQGTGFPSYFNPNLSDYGTDQINLAINDFNSSNTLDPDWGYLVYANGPTSASETPEPGSLVLGIVGLFFITVLRTRFSRGMTTRI